MCFLCCAATLARIIHAIIGSVYRLDFYNVHEPPVGLHMHCSAASVFSDDISVERVILISIQFVLKES